MTEHSFWRFACEYICSLSERPTDQLEAILDENVDWAIYGPIDIFAFFGARRGKLAVIDTVRQFSNTVRIHNLRSGDGQAGPQFRTILMRYSLTPANSSRPISVRMAQLTYFRSGRLTNLLAVIDTFGLVEQSLGRKLHLPKIA
ncbi:ketosteroid isomerase [Bradyrhizobium sp. 41S5]|uniref:ketosteroid isomerase n=1 Tax=Bradyrhizobium sp. 41S5 TaxID=1404443 RepID=UPI00156B1D83|nr:ketosteroid isomerase [Bradyrhizobium sp. 41S5]UFX43948.1 ketosteroid isomerase [Bradyrhizobium sp. 41S5]